ncbi:hypothetical protein [Vibrio sp. B1FLJ16]|uniref:hypothetical protein n=1 Tax=Vibrio sp. B1FLJ16 TaxID=2751178 RepID=UPI0015F45E7E|nr:hypothetical protein [Vibrio sp. B1FLJ16]
MKSKSLIFRNLLFLCLSFLLSACSSKPRLVTASTPLVAASAQSLSGTKIPENYWSQLEQTYSSVLAHPQYKIVLKPSYVSALGNECRELLITGQHHSNVRVACVYIDAVSEQREWYLMPTLDYKTSDISL